MVSRDVARDSYTQAWLGLATLLGVSGLAGCLGRYFPWVGPFAWGDGVYSSLILKPLVAGAGLLAPSGGEGVPACLAHYLVVCMGMFILVNITWRNVMGQTLIVDAFRDSGRFGAPVFLFFSFTLTPALLPFTLLFSDSLSQEGQTLVRVQLRCYLAWAVFAIVLLVVNQALKAF